jgi:HEPN domain-containing protein
VILPTKNAAADKDFEWSAAAQQAAEKAAKALILASGGDHPGHSVALMLEALHQASVGNSRLHCRCVARTVAARLSA